MSDGYYTTRPDGKEVHELPASPSPRRTALPIRLALVGLLAAGACVGSFLFGQATEQSTLMALALERVQQGCRPELVTAVTEVSEETRLRQATEVFVAQREVAGDDAVSYEITTAPDGRVVGIVTWEDCK